MLMKERRLELIREIIRHEIIETQDELAAQLRKRRIAVTQATVYGRYRYALPAQENYAFTKERMRRIFNDTIIDCDYSENILVVRTLPGGANTVAAALDYCKWPEIIGTVAGDDSILVVIKPKETAPVVRKRILDMLQD